MRRLLARGALAGVILLLAMPARAQLNGAHSLGDFGVLAGTQPQPGFYACALLLPLPHGRHPGR